MATHKCTDKTTLVIFTSSFKLAACSHCSHRFGRVWVIQEAALANRALLICGDWTVPFDDLYSVLEAARFQTFDHNDQTKPATSMGMSRVSTLGWTREATRVSTPLGQDLMNLVRLARASLATNPVDYLYAMLGLSEERDVPELAPDYSEPLPTTLKRYAKFFVKQGQAFEMLMHVNQSLWAIDEPTWIPSWTRPQGPIEKRLLWKDCFRIPFETATSVRGEVSSDWDDETNPPWLMVKGCVLATVDTLGKNHREANSALTGALLNELPREVFREQMLEPLHLLGMTGPLAAFPSMQAVLRGGPGADADDIAVVGEFDFDTCCCMIAEDDWRTPDDENFEGYMSSMVQTLSHLIKTTNWSKLATTAGGTIGRVPHTTQEGDIVALFAGAKVPFILRQTSEEVWEFKVVGPCYMQGIMFGECAHLFTEEYMVDFVLV